MRRTTIFVVIFIVVVAAIIGASQFLQTQPPLPVTVAVDPLAAAWIRDAADVYNATSPLVGTRRIQIVVQEVSDVDVWRGETNWTAANHPNGWIPASSVSLEYASSHPFEMVQTSIARTLLVWGGFSSRVAVLTADSTQLFDWDALAAAAATDGGRWAMLPGGESGWGFIKFAFPTPERSMVGLAVLLSGAADFADSTILSGAQTGSADFRAWMQPVVESVPNFQTLGADPAATLASRGASVADVALLAESQWLTSINSLIGGAEEFVFSYPQYQFAFDFPLAVWDDATTTDEIRSAISGFGTFLLSAAQQTSATGFGLRPATTEPTATAALFAAGESSGILLTPPVTDFIQSPARTDAQSLIQWFVQAR
jgi:hypothetical protein